MTVGLTQDAAREVLRIGEDFYARVQMNPAAIDTYTRLVTELGTSSNRDYRGDYACHFNRLVLLMCRFVQTRMDALGRKYPYLGRVAAGTDFPLEAALQDDLEEFLNASCPVQAERSGIASGRADLYLPQPHRIPFRFVVEVKRHLPQWTDDACTPFLRQTTAYQQTDLKLGVLAVLDLSDRPSGVPDFDECLWIADRRVSGRDVRHALVVRVPGNKRTPSDHAEPRRSKRT